MCAGGVANQHYDVVLDCYAGEVVSVIGVCFKEVFPVFFHCVFAFGDVSFIVYECVVVSHQFS